VDFILKERKVGILLQGNSFYVVHLIMKIKGLNKKTIQQKELNSISSDLQKVYVERIERFMALVELSYALKIAPRIIQKK
jgi:hypothetical protein